MPQLLPFTHSNMHSHFRPELADPQLTVKVGNSSISGHSRQAIVLRPSARGEVIQISVINDCVPSLIILLIHCKS